MNTTTMSHSAARPAGLGRLLPMTTALLASLATPFALATRLYVSWQFLKSGYLKISSWETTLSLFRDEYHVPLLPPGLAAVAGTFGELFFPVLADRGAVRAAERPGSVRGQRDGRDFLPSRAADRGVSKPRSATRAVGLHAADVCIDGPWQVVGRLRTAPPSWQRHLVTAAI